MQGKDMPGVNGSGPVWSQLLNMEPPDSPLNNADDELLRGYRDSGMESLDYEVVESVAYREDQAQRGIWHHASYISLKWIYALLIGIGTGLAAFFINIAVENFSGWKFAATFAVMEHSYFLGLVLYIAFNGALVFSSVYIITQFAPAAAGSGIPEIKAYLNGIDTPGILLFRTLVGKIFGSIGSVGGGLALGKEGPLVHTGACIASVLGQGGSTKYNVNWRWLRRFKNDRDRRDLVTCGCAAGVAAAFRSPVGGVLFALEEVTSWWRSQLLWRVFFTSAVVAVVVRTAMSWCKNGSCGHFSSGGFIIWDISGGQDDYSFYELLPMAMLGAIGGLLGALFNQLTIWISAWRRNVLHKKGNRVKIIEVLLVSLITSLLSFGLPMMTSCKPCPDPVKYPGVTCPRPSGNYGNYVNFFCSSGDEYNDLATIFFNTQDDAIRNLFSTNTPHEYTSRTLLTFLVMFFSLAVLTYGTAVPSGQFVPGIMIGATYGRLVGILVVNASSKDSVDEGTYALLGAASFLGGSMRMTVSLCVIMVEITNNLQLLPLIMLVLLISKAVGDAFNNGFYEEQVRLRSLPLLESRPQRFMRNLAAKDAISAKKVVQFSRVSKISQIVAVLRSTNHNGFPVSFQYAILVTHPNWVVITCAMLLLLLDVRLTYEDAVDSPNELMLEAFLSLMNTDAGRSSDLVRRSISLLIFQVVDKLQTGEPVVIGLILRSYLLVLLQAKADFQHSPIPGDIRSQINFRYDVRDFTKPASSKGLSIYEINISPQEMEMYIDLQPFVNPTPYIVPEDMSLTKVYNLFRQLGLRHICVVPRPSQVVGIITRKDLLPEVLEERDSLDDILSSRGRLGPEA